MVVEADHLLLEADNVLPQVGNQRQLVASVP